MGEPEGRTDGQNVAEDFRRVEGSLLRCAARNAPDPEAARDVVQETFLRFWTVDSARIHGREREWFLRVCRNLALDVRKKENRVICMSQTSPETRARLEEPPDGQPPPDARLEAQELAQQLKSVMDALPKNQQHVIHLRFDDDMTYRQIAALMSCTVNSVHSLLRRAVGTFRKAFGVDPAHLARRKRSRS